MAEDVADDMGTTVELTTLSGLWTRTSHLPCQLS